MTAYADPLSRTFPVFHNIGTEVKKTVRTAQVSSYTQGSRASWNHPAYLFNGLEIGRILKEITILLQDNEYDDDFLKPTDYAINETKRLLLDLVWAVFRLPIKGSVSTDGSGGIRVEWAKNSKEVRLIVSADQEGQSFIYYENGLFYQADRIVSIEALLKRLKWLEN